uniref:B30.2/SPRY domain-containing protein n=1 Tax=Neolamprologus brichardi TaxID=32507 RepID=A0A3Q4MDZ0_NEOBR
VIVFSSFDLNLAIFRCESVALSLFCDSCSQLQARKVKCNLKKKFQVLFEGVAKAGNPTLLNEIYTELYITEGETGKVNDEHEIRQIEAVFKKTDTTEKTIKCEDIFKTSSERDGPIRTVLTNGVAGIGKTVLTQKYTLDWAEDKANQDIQFIFPFTFRELNVLKEKKFSLRKLLHHFFSETKGETYKYDKPQVVFIFDGLDECRLPLDFEKNKTLTNVRKSTSLDVLLTNLISGKLLPSARLWITTRPAAANQIPPEYVHMVTEVRGFSDPQKEEYFRKRFRDERQASIVLSNIQTSRSLHIMCHIPVFCWITATVLEDVLKTREGGQLPKTLTEMYIHFLVVQAKVKKVKYDGGAETYQYWRKMTEALGKLAFEQLQKGNLIFYESDLTECGIDIRAASVYSGVFTQIFKEEKGLYQEKLFCFIHLSVQEFLAALHVHLTFINSGVNLLSDAQSKSKLSELLFKDNAATKFYQTAVDKALQSPNGHLDLFLRFLLGLSLETNQSLLQGLPRQEESCSKPKQKTIQYIKKMITKVSSQRSINLFYCLNELNDSSLVEEIQKSLRSGRLSTNELSPAHWSALVFILLSSEENLDVFDLKKYSASEEAVLRLLPVVKTSSTALLSDCKLTERSCLFLANVFHSPLCNLIELDLSNNNLQDSGVISLCAGLQNPNCQLKTLRLDQNSLTSACCQDLSSVLSTQSSLRTLSLNYNELQNSAVKLLSDGLSSPQCKLQILGLDKFSLICGLTEKRCASLASALTSNPFSLKELDLSYNHPGDLGAKLLSAKLKDPQCSLETLRYKEHFLLYIFLPTVACGLTLDPDTAHRNLALSADRKAVLGSKRPILHSRWEVFPSSPEVYYKWEQVLCTQGLTGLRFWEVEWKGTVSIGVTYKAGPNKGPDESWHGGNDRSWILLCKDNHYSAWHNYKMTKIRLPRRPVGFQKVGVFLDWPAGILSFFDISSDTPLHLHTFFCRFTEPLYPALWFWFTLEMYKCSAALCD